MKYKTAHEIARELLAGPDVMTVVAMPVFDMPGCSHALPVKTRLQTVEGRECVIVSAGGGGEETSDSEPPHSATDVGQPSGAPVLTERDAEQAMRTRHKLPSL